MTQSTPRELAFGPFRMDRGNARLLKDGKPLALTPKAFDVLHYLAARPQKLVTKDELLSAIWPDVIVSDAVKVCILEVRKSLGDGAKAPKYVETVHRRGYRFIAEVTEGWDDDAPTSKPVQVEAVASLDPHPPAPQPLSMDLACDDHLFVSRDAEMRQLLDTFAAAAGGERRLVLISSGPGAGKTTLVEGFLRCVCKPGGTDAAPTVLVGHCFEQFGTAEPYLPVWEALGRGARERPSKVLSSLLARHAAAYEPSVAPSVPTASGATASPSAAGVPRAMSARVLREIADGLEALAAETPLVLLLEDVHWADYSTVDLLSALARRPDAARLMVIATYRPAEVLADKHPLREIVQELAATGLCTEIALDFLDEAAVAQYLAARFPGSDLPDALARRLHQRTDGHPLFLVHLVNDLVEQGVLLEAGGRWRVTGAASESVGIEAEAAAWLAVLDTHIPRTVRGMIELQLDRLAPGELQALEAAAVAGVQFTAAAVAAATVAATTVAAATAATAAGDDVVRAEQVCEDLARRHHLLQPLGLSEWPDGTVASHYRFVHELYHNVVYERIPAARRVRLHHTLGLRLESAWAARLGEESAELAMHFELGWDWPRAVKYLRQCADAANRQYAHREAVTYLRRALVALERLSAAGRAEHELTLLRLLGVNLQVTRGFAAPEVEEVHARAYALCEAAGDSSDPDRRGGSSSPAEIASTFPVLWGIWVFHKVRSDLRRAREMARRLLALARGSGDAALVMQAHQAACVTALCSGEPAVCADHMQQADALYDPGRHAENTRFYGQDPGVATLAFGSVALQIMGRPDDASLAGRRSLELARHLAQPSSLAVALHFSAMLHQLRGDAASVERTTDEAIALAAEEGFSFWHAGARVLRGWARATRDDASGNDSARADAVGGVAEILEGLDAWRDTGSRTYVTYYLGLLADALLRNGRPSDALPRLGEAMAAARDLPEGLYEAELHRLRARAVIHAAGTGRGNDAEALQSLSRATIVARQQGAKWFETLAATDLAGLLRRQGRAGEADLVLQRTSAETDLADESRLRIDSDFVLI